MNIKIISNARKFFLPIIFDKFLYIRGIVIYGIIALNPIIHIIFIEKITAVLELKNQYIFNKIIFGYIIYIIIYELLEIILRNWGWSELAEKTQKIIHNNFIRDYIKLDNTETEKVGSGKTISIMEKGFYRWSYLLDLTFSIGVTIFFNLIFTFYVLSKLSFSYSLIFIFIFFTINIFVIYINNFVSDDRISIVEERTNYTNQIFNIIMSKFDILKNGIIEKEIGNLDKNIDNIVNLNRKIVPFNLIIKRLPIFILVIFDIIIILFLGNKIIIGTETISSFVLIFSTLALVSNTVNYFLNLFKSYVTHFHTIEKLWIFFDKTKSIEGYDINEEFSYNSGDIELKNISFSYTNRKKLLENFNLTIKGGKITALVGGKGGGKKTIAKIILRYINPDNGDLIIDGQNIKDISLKSYFRNIAYLSNNPYLSKGTIYDNLSNYLDENLDTKQSIQKIEEVLSLSNCNFVFDLPQGIFTEIGGNCRELTIGEKERLSIARIFLKDPKILIIDEFNSPLDYLNEDLTTKAIYNLIAGRTVIIIAHKTQTLKIADDIILIEDGELIERGNHNELISKDGYYNKLLSLEYGI